MIRETQGEYYCNVK